jgi:hypothetical protein
MKPSDMPRPFTPEHSDVAYHNPDDVQRIAHLEMRLAGVCWRNGHDNTEVNYDDTTFLRCRVCDMNEVDQAEEIA